MLREWENGKIVDDEPGKALTLGDASDVLRQFGDAFSDHEIRAIEAALPKGDRESFHALAVEMKLLPDVPKKSVGKRGLAIS